MALVIPANGSVASCSCCQRSLIDQRRPSSSLKKQQCLRVGAFWHDQIDGRWIGHGPSLVARLAQADPVDRRSAMPEQDQVEREERVQLGLRDRLQRLEFNLVTAGDLVGGGGEAGCADCDGLVSTEGSALRGELLDPGDILSAAALTAFYGGERPGGCADGGIDLAQPAGDGAGQQFGRADRHAGPSVLLNAGDELLEQTPFGVCSSSAGHALPVLAAPKNIGKKLVCRRRRRMSPGTMVLALRRSPPAAVSTSMSGLLMIA
jgi:hypothetical protein